MIPIVAGQTLEVTDRQGKVHKLRYITELDNQMEYFKLSQIRRKEIDRFEAEVEAEGNLPEEPKQREIELYQRATDKQTSWRNENPESWFPLLDRYIKLFVVDEEPVLYHPKMVLWGLIQENMYTLTGLTVEDSKN